MSDDRHPDGTESASEPDAPEVDQPGLGALRAAVATMAKRTRPGKDTKRDAVAGLNVAIANVPDGLANGLLVGVNPVYGLYATMVGPAAGGLVSSTQRMVITTTAAASLTAGQALSNLPPAAREEALFIMVVMVGIFQLTAGALNLGRLTRFVSYSVTTGFLTGIAVLLVLSQLPTITGVAASGANRVTQTLDLLVNAGQIVPWSLALAVLTLALAVGLPKTPLANAGRLLAVVIPSVILVVFGLEGVEIVEDVGEIPDRVPMPTVPALAATFDVLTGAFAVAVVILVQGAGVSQSVPNRDGSRTSASRDFMAQGTANVVSGLFRGLPVGGSMSATALGVLAGARTRWTTIFAGLWMALLVIGVPGIVSYVAMPALGALLIVAGVSSVEPAEIRSVWDAGWPSRLAGGATFLATLFLPIQAAVGIGVVLSALLYLNESSTDIRVVKLVRNDDGLIEERSAPKQLPSNDVTVLDVYGHLFYAGARTLEQLLPDVGRAEHPVVVLRLRGRTTLGATLVEVLTRYAEDLQRCGGRLYLSGMGAHTYAQAEASGKLRLSGPVRIYEASSVIGESTTAAYEDAEAFLIRVQNDNDA